MNMKQKYDKLSDDLIILICLKQQQHEEPQASNLQPQVPNYKCTAKQQKKSTNKIKYFYLIYF